MKKIFLIAAAIVAISGTVLAVNQFTAADCCCGTECTCTNCSCDEGTCNGSCCDSACCEENGAEKACSNESKDACCKK